MSRDQYEEMRPMLEYWMLMVPTLCFLDVCSVGHIKDYLATGAFKDEKHEASILNLKRYDMAQHGVSYLPALMEKASDQRSKFDENNFVIEAKGDWEALRKFFDSARIVEPQEFIESYAREVFGVHPEIKIPDYLKFLEFANSLRLHDNIKGSSKRLGVLDMLCEKADELDISRRHPVVITTAATLFGCEAAKHVMKFCGNPNNFNAGNALGDIQLVQRVKGTLTKAIEQEEARGGRFKKGEFITADSGLQKLFQYFKVQVLDEHVGEDGVAQEFHVEPVQCYLFVDLFDENLKPKGGKAGKALEQVRKMLLLA
ncbi:hypothetical protein [Herbaspirillum camelliae]|uniref:hypothetical protein n=1 Tax=Herbaspirillum camelliae TaxID=1892903 RepID=UPI000949DDCC|nr:hypothetical protein [Herbaspirillum camelliae]